MDFGHFGDTTTNPSPRTASQQQPSGQNSGFNPNTNNQQTSTETDAASKPEPVFMHTIEHGGVSCDVCQCRVRGFRYKCMQCPDFDLCTTCERKGHHPGHVMMRIAFPEQTPDAIRHYLGNSPASPLGGPGFPTGLAGFRHESTPLRGHRRCHRSSTTTGNGNQRDSDGESGEDGDGQPQGPCPYGLGRRGMKKWAKCMKKMAYQQRRSAEQYARSAQEATQATRGESSGVAASTDAATAGGGPLDFTAAASQIQEFLNAFGIPIDVVELYDNFGNHGQPRPEASQQTTVQADGSTSNTAATSTNAQGQQASNTTEDVSGQVNNGNITSPAVGGTNSAQQSTLATHLQQLHLTPDGQMNQSSENGSNGIPSAPIENPVEHVTMELDVDSDSAGWTLLENENEGDNVNGSVTTGTVGIVEPISVPTVEPPQPLPAPQSVPYSFPTLEPNLNNVRPRTLSVGPQPPANGSVSNARVYPALHPPQLQQLLSGVSQAMNSVVRNIPIVTNPSGPGLYGANDMPANGNARDPEMDTKCLTTLNQLLAMGFSNHDGWLSRLVIAKKGDLEGVLNALFPNPME